MKTWLILDCNYLCHRAFHSMRGLSFREVHTGVAFGFFRELVNLQSLHGASRVVFAFDHGKGLRARDFPQANYKRKRRPENLTRQEQSIRAELQKQIRYLRLNYLPSLGYRNVYYKFGYEADDIIASVCLDLPARDEAIIVSADKDLFQLLSERVCIYNPHQKKATTLESFQRDFGVSATQWVDVKAIAGCGTDEVVGVAGIGEKTAAKFLNGTLKPDSKAHQAIVNGNAIWKRNRPLVQLPYPGVPKYKYRKDRVTRKRWRRVMESLGMNSLLDDYPS